MIKRTKLRIERKAEGSKQDEIRQNGKQMTTNDEITQNTVSENNTNKQTKNVIFLKC